MKDRLLLAKADIHDISSHQLKSPSVGSADNQRVSKLADYYWLKTSVDQRDTPEEIETVCYPNSNKSLVQDFSATIAPLLYEYQATISVTLEHLLLFDLLDEYQNNSVVDSGQIIKNEFSELLSKYYSTLKEEGSVAYGLISQWIERRGMPAVELLENYINLRLVGDNIISDLLIALGDTNYQWDYKDRLHYLEQMLSDKSPKIRYGALIGISNIDSPSSISRIKDFLKKEKIIPLINTAKSVIEQLRATQKE